jgi:hypothetical protein
MIGLGMRYGEEAVVLTVFGFSPWPKSLDRMPMVEFPRDARGPLSVLRE